MQNQTEIILAGERLAERLKKNSEGDYLEKIYKNKPQVLAQTLLLLQMELKKTQVDMETIMGQACLLCSEHDKETVKKHMNLWFKHIMEGKVYEDADQLSTDLDVRERLRQKSVNLAQIFQNAMPASQAVDRIKTMMDAQADEILDNLSRDQSPQWCPLF